MCTGYEKSGPLIPVTEHQSGNDTVDDDLDWLDQL